MNYISNSKSFQQFQDHLEQLETQLNEANKRGVPLEEVMNTKLKEMKDKYPNGYWDKIQYWQRELNIHSINQNIRLMDSVHRKLDYFIGKQWELEFPTVKIK
jgi:predicted nuclease with TOPRIM domain